MGRTFTHLFTRIVFSTKNRARLIVPDLKPELYAYLGGLTRELKGRALAINGMEDHVHLLASLPPTISVSDALALELYALDFFRSITDFSFRAFANWSRNVGLSFNASRTITEEAYTVASVRPVRS